MSQDSNPNLALRIKVVNGGCHGFQYLMSLTTLPSDINSTIAQTDDNQYHSVKNLISDDSGEITSFLHLFSSLFPYQLTLQS